MHHDQHEWKQDGSAAIKRAFKSQRDEAQHGLLSGQAKVAPLQKAMTMSFDEEDEDHKESADASGQRNSLITALTSAGDDSPRTSTGDYSPREAPTTRSAFSDDADWGRDKGRGASGGGKGRATKRAAHIHTGKIHLQDLHLHHPKEPSKLLKYCARFSRAIVDNKYVVFFSVVLTVFALMGDDFRLLCFDKSADLSFNIITILCIVFFFAEVLFSCIGKNDYFLSFFFFLDTTATITLILDLTWVNEYMFSGGNSDMELGDRARSGRTARIGASVGRMVRVLRLVRIFKLYKAYYASKRRKEREAKEREAKKMESQQGLITPGRKLSAAPGHAVSTMYDDEADEEKWAEEEEEASLNKKDDEAKESLVGKKLSALTTRRVIILVLTMLLVLPSLRVIDPVTASGPSFAADGIHQALLELEQGTGSREVYERAMLKAIYYHNWYTGQDSCDNRGCPNDYFAHLFWVGAAGSNIAYVKSRAAQAKLSQTTVKQWEAEIAAQDDNIYNYGAMPPEVVPVLSQPWTVECTVYGVDHIGLSITDKVVPDKLEDTFRCPTDLRPSEWLRFNPRMLTQDEYKAFHLVLYFDMRPYVKLESLFGLGVTIFVCSVLTISSIYFTSDANRLVLHPIEAMITKLEAIRDNPLVAMKLADAEFKTEEVQKMKANLTQRRKLKMYADLMSRFRPASWSSVDKVTSSTSQARRHHAESEMYETVILEKTIIKLGWLLSLVFGEAGANIVSQNMSGNATAGVNAMVEGTKVECIIGHARICNFSTATEVLQGKVMTFVNQVAEIVHGIVDQFHGAANQNNGNTFLLIWRMFGMDKDKVAKLGDMSVVAFATILGAIHKSPVLASYRAHPGLQQRLGSNHKVSLTFGLHAGWAIEGAVGSEFKIDASYLSPNVTIAASLERATKTYGVNFLTSQTVARLCHKKLLAKLRLIDKVTLSGSIVPLDLYTLDLDVNNVQIDQPVARNFPWNVRQRFRARQFLEAEKLKKWSIDLHVEDNFDQKDILDMRRTYTFEFLCLFNRGYQNYSQGEWQVARRVLSQTYSMLGVKDGPSGALLSFMEASYQFAAPDGWTGVRKLDLDADLMVDS